MGKGYNNYMCKKPFHPGSKANIKRAWMAEQKTENDKRKQDELKLQYEKEQELYNNRTLLNKESKDKLCLNFMYEAPPGVKKEHEREDNEPEFKFEWQRKYNAPREDYARGNAEIRDQPFGIQVRNVRCIKCHKWGHINTDKECPLFNKGTGVLDGSAGMDPVELMRRMKEEEGLALKQSILGHRINPNEANQQLLPSDNEGEDAEMQFLKSLSTKQKEKLLRRLEKLEKSKNGKQERKKKSKKKKSKKAKKRISSTDSSDESDHKSLRKKKMVRKRKSKRDASSSNSSASESARTSRERRRRHDSSKSESSRERKEDRDDEDATAKRSGKRKGKRVGKRRSNSDSDSCRNREKIESRRSRSRDKQRRKIRQISSTN